MNELAQFLGVNLGGMLPPFTFFHPTSKFIGHMAANYNGRLIYDIGAGVGHVSRALADAGLAVEALDLYHRDEEEFPITFADATTHEFVPGSVVMFCRPSHDGYVAQTITTALTCKVAEIIYVGLPKNTAADLGRYRPAFRRRLRGIGRLGENLYVMTPVAQSISVDRLDGAPNSETVLRGKLLP